MNIIKIIIVVAIIAVALWALGKWVNRQSAACEAQWQVAVEGLR